MPSATSARITALTFRPNCRTNRPSMPRQSVTSSSNRGKKSRKWNVLAADDSGLIRTKCCIKRKGSPRKSAVVRCKKKYDYRTKSDNALRRCSTFVPVKASEPKVRHFRPVLTSSLRCSDVIYDPFRWYFRGVKYRIYDRKVTCLRVIGTFRTIQKWYTLRHHWLTV